MNGKGSRRRPTDERRYRTNWASVFDLAPEKEKPMSEIMEKHQKRFLEKIDRGPGCWAWRAGKTSLGYGQFRVDGRNLYAHRVAWAHFRGELPEEAVVCHSCDNPACVNPDHLFLGTQADNLADMARKGRQGGARLDQEKADEIRRRHARGETQTALAAEFGVSQATVWRVVEGRSWRHGS